MEPIEELPQEIPQPEKKTRRRRKKVVVESTSESDKLLQEPQSPVPKRRTRKSKPLKSQSAEEPKIGRPKKVKRPANAWATCTKQWVQSQKAKGLPSSFPKRDSEGYHEVKKMYEKMKADAAKSVCLFCNVWHLKSWNVGFRISS